MAKNKEKTCIYCGYKSRTGNMSKHIESMHKKPAELRRAPPGKGVKNRDAKCSECDKIIKNGNMGYHKKHQCVPKPEPVFKVIDGKEYTATEFRTAFSIALSKNDMAMLKKLKPESFSYTKMEPIYGPIRKSEEHDGFNIQYSDYKPFQGVNNEIVVKPVE